MTLPRAVIFDMDGVLVDSYRPHWHSWQETCAARGITLSEERYATLFGRSFRAFVDALVPDGLDEEAIRVWYDDKERRYRAIIERDFPAIDGAGELLEELHQAGFALAIASSGPRGNVDCVCRLLPGADHFACTVSGDDTATAKPDPEVFLRAAAGLGLPPGDCCVIEDSIHGLRAARAAGMASIALVGTEDVAALEPQADLVVASLRLCTPAAVAALIDRR